jgi:hypothetical protein
MLSQANRDALNSEGYRYIVGARLANTKLTFLNSIRDKLPKNDGATIRISDPSITCDIVCAYSHARYKKDKRELDKQIQRAEMLIARKEPGRRAKFVKKSNVTDKPYMFDEALKLKTELLLGVKGYCTNIPEAVLSNEQVVEHYHSLWRVEQTFRMSKSDLKSRPIFHHTHDAIRAHVLICFTALMMGKFIEIKTGFSLRYVRDLLWLVQEVHLHDPHSSRQRIACTPIPAELTKVLDCLDIKIRH